MDDGPRGRRIRVNAISPGTIDTPGLNELLASEKRVSSGERWSRAPTLGRFGQPDEVAKAVVFLASDDKRYITGTELFVDGGFGANLNYGSTDDPTKRG